MKQSGEGVDMDEFWPRAVGWESVFSARAAPPILKNSRRDCGINIRSDEQRREQSRPAVHEAQSSLPQNAGPGRDLIPRPIVCAARSERVTTDARLSRKP